MSFRLFGALLSGALVTELVYYFSALSFVLPVVVSEKFLASLFDSIKADPTMKVRIDLPAQTITNLATGETEQFDINGYKKYCLMNALDDIDFLVESKDKIEAYEKK